MLIHCCPLKKESMVCCIVQTRLQCFPSTLWRQLNQFVVCSGAAQELSIHTLTESVVLLCLFYALASVVVRLPW